MRQEPGRGCGGMVDARDSKSRVRKYVSVRVRPPAPFTEIGLYCVLDIQLERTVRRQKPLVSFVAAEANICAAFRHGILPLRTPADTARLRTPGEIISIGDPPAAGLADKALLESRFQF